MKGSLAYYASGIKRYVYKPLMFGGVLIYTMEYSFAK